MGITVKRGSSRAKCHLLFPLILPCGAPPNAVKWLNDSNGTRGDFLEVKTVPNWNEIYPRLSSNTHSAIISGEAKETSGRIIGSVGLRVFFLFHWLSQCFTCSVANEFSFKFPLSWCCDWGTLNISLCHISTVCMCLNAPSNTSHQVSMVELWIHKSVFLFYHMHRKEKPAIFNLPLWLFSRKPIQI